MFLQNENETGKAEGWGADILFTLAVSSNICQQFVFTFSPFVLLFMLMIRVTEKCLYKRFVGTYKPSQGPILNQLCLWPLIPIDIM